MTHLAPVPAMPLPGTNPVYLPIPMLIAVPTHALGSQKTVTISNTKIENM